MASQAADSDLVSATTSEVTSQSTGTRSPSSIGDNFIDLILEHTQAWRHCGLQSVNTTACGLWPYKECVLQERFDSYKLIFQLQDMMFDILKVNKPLQKQWNKDYNKDWAWYSPCYYWRALSEWADKHGIIYQDATPATLAVSDTSMQRLPAATTVASSKCLKRAAPVEEEYAIKRRRISENSDSMTALSVQGFLEELADDKDAASTEMKAQLENFPHIALCVVGDGLVLKL